MIGVPPHRVYPHRVYPHRVHPLRASPRRVHPHRVPVITVFQNAVGRYFRQPGIIRVMMSMKGKAGMGSDELEGIFLRHLRVITFPAGYVAGQRWPLSIIGEMLSQSLRNELYLAAVGSQFFPLLRIPLGIIMVGGIAFTPFVKPAI